MLREPYLADAQLGSTLIDPEVKIGTEKARPARLGPCSFDSSGNLAHGSDDDQ